MILRRKYDPYRNIIKRIDLVEDKLERIDKLNVSLCCDSAPVRKRPSTSVSGFGVQTNC